MTDKFKKKVMYIIAMMLCLILFVFATRGIYVPDNDFCIVLSDEEITVDGVPLRKKGEVYLSKDVIYYEDKDFYENGSIYGEGTTEEKYTAEQASETTVVNITTPGVYRFSGKLSQGQIRVNLGEEAYKDKNAVVTVVLDGVDLNCDVAPAIVFMNVYECDANKSMDNAGMNVFTEDAGANLVIADGSVNNINGSYVAKIYKSNEAGKKLWKQDGAIYSYMTMNINGGAENSGVLNLTAEKEGISSEKHLTINGGNINITAMDDGINVNEDAISVVTINGGKTHIIAGMSPIGGDGIDSNGWLVVNGGTLISMGYQKSDTGVDNENGLYINGGTVVSIGHFIDYPRHHSTQNILKLKYLEEFSSEDAIIVTDRSGKVVFCYDASEDDIIGRYINNRQGVIIASSDFVVGETYNIYMGGTVYGEHSNGLYDVSTVKGFTGARQQVHHSDEEFNQWGLYDNERQKFDADTNFVFRTNVNCFGDIADYMQ